MPTQNQIYVDVDNTLVNSHGEVNLKLIEWIREQRKLGYEFTLWSMRGSDYAFECAVRLEIEDLFRDCVAKPNRIIDDVGWRWINFSRPISFEDIADGLSLPKLEL